MVLFNTEILALQPHVKAILGTDLQPHFGIAQSGIWGKFEKRKSVKY